MIFSMEKISFYLAFVVLCCGLLSCTAKKDKKDILTIGVMSSTDLLPYAIAQKNGYFEKWGVKVDIQKFYSANDRDASFQSKSIDGTITDLTGAIIQHAKGIDGVITSKEFGVFHILTNDNHAESMADLKRKTVASSRNTVIDFIIDMGLKASGLKSEDIVRQEVNKIPIRLEMLRNYKTDATGLPEPFISIAVNDGMKSIVSAEDLGYNVTCMFFRRSVIDEKSEQLKALYQAYNEAVDYIKTTERSEFKDILIKDLGVPEYLIDAVILPDYEKAALPLDRDIEAVSLWLKEKALIPSSYVPEHLIDGSSF